jgi:hypothetical protein
MLYICRRDLKSLHFKDNRLWQTDNLKIIEVEKLQRCKVDIFQKVKFSVLENR